MDQVFVLWEVMQRQKRNPYYLAFLDIKRAYDVIEKDCGSDANVSCGRGRPENGVEGE